MVTVSGSELPTPSINAALVRPLSPTGTLALGKASGFLIKFDDELYVVTNWHVATGKRWMTAADRQAWQDGHPGETAWASKQDCYSPFALEILLPLSGSLLLLSSIQIDDPVEPADGPIAHSYAWDDPSRNDRLGDDRPI